MVARRGGCLRVVAARRTLCIYRESDALSQRGGIVFLSLWSLVALIGCSLCTGAGKLVLSRVFSNLESFSSEGVPGENVRMLGHDTDHVAIAEQDVPLIFQVLGL